MSKKNNAPETKTVTPANPWVDAFKVGKFSDISGKEHSFSEKDLQDLNTGVQGQLKSGFKPAVVTGHPKVDSPREGSIVDSRIQGDILQVKVDEVNPDFAEDVKKGRWKYVSAAVYGDLKKGIRHLGALGANPPAMKGMAELAFGEGMFAELDAGEKPENVIYFAQPFEWDRLVPASVFERLIWRIASLGELYRHQRDALIEDKGVEAADKQYPEYAVKNLESITEILKDEKQFPKVPPVSSDDSQKPVPVTVTNFGEENNEETAGGNRSPKGPDEGNPAETERLKLANAALEEKVAKLESANATAENARAFAEFSEKLNGLTKDGRLLPAQRAPLESLFKAFKAIPVDGEGMFGEGDDRVSPRVLLDDMLKAMPKVVAFGENYPQGSASDFTPREFADGLNGFIAEQKSKGRELNFAEAYDEFAATQKLNLTPKG